MNKLDIVNHIAKEMYLQQNITKRIVQMVFDGMIDTLAAEGKLELRNFGVFKIKTRRPRRARNPKSGATVMVPERKTVTFKIGKIMEEKVLGNGSIPPATPPTT